MGRLNGIAPGGVVVLVAPSGYGVTSLLAMAAEASSDPVVWVSVRPRGDLVASFWAQLADGLARVGVTIPDPGVGDHELSRVAGFAGAVSRGPRALLVVDDVPRDEAVEELLQHILDELPPTLRVLLRARAVPRLDLSRLLGSGRLVLLGRADLSLSPQESEEFVGLLAPGLPAGRRQALVNAADGWIAALRAGVTAAGPDPGTDPATWLLGPGLELLFGRGLAQLDEEDRDLLVACSVLGRLAPEACDSVLARSDSAERLVSLSERMVVGRVPGPGPVTYDVHPLFGEFLRGKLAERGRGAQARAHRAAGLWLAQQGDTEGAISNLLDCGEIEQAREVLTAQVRTLLDGGHSDRVRTWYRRAPELAVPDQLLHVLAAAWSELLSGDIAAAGEHLAELEAGVAHRIPAMPDPGDAAGAGAQWLRVEVLFLRSFLESWSGQTDPAAEHLREVRAAFGHAWSRMSHQGAGFHEVRLALWRGELGQARSMLLDLSGRPGTLQFHRQVAIPSLGSVLAAEEGRAHRACFLAESALEAVASSGGISVVDGFDARLARARALVDLGQGSAAQVEASRVEADAAGLGHVPYLVLAQVARARALVACGQGPGAQEQIESARLVLRRRGGRGPLAHVLDRVSVEVAIAVGDRSGARRALALLPADRHRGLLMVRLLAMGGNLDDVEVVRQVREARPQTPREVVDARMLMAALAAPTRPAEAAMHLRQAAALADEHGMLLALRGRSEEVLALAGQLAGPGTHPAVAALVTALGPPVEFDEHVAPTLSKGERDLIERLATDAGNRELAAELGISTNTLKTRLRRLYAKLGVHDRASALRVTGSRD